MIGPSAYDVASLAQDARVIISPELEAQLLRRYKSQRLIQGSDFNSLKFDETYAIMAAQRAVKLLGIFVRLNERDGKNGYLQYIPQIETYLIRACCHNVLTPLRLWFKRAGVLKNAL